MPDRGSESIQRWLQAHPGAEAISRDRAGAYAEAARKAASGAVQVADRWHLLHDPSENLQQVLASKHVLLTQAVRIVASQTLDPVSMEPKSCNARSPAVERRSEANRGRKLACYEAVMELVRKGISQTEIARTLAIDRRTVRRWSRAEAFPERRTELRKHALDRYAAYLERRRREVAAMQPNSGVRFARKAFAGAHAWSGSGFANIMDHVYVSQRRKRRRRLLRCAPRRKP